MRGERTVVRRHQDRNRAQLSELWLTRNLVIYYLYVVLLCSVYVMLLLKRKRRAAARARARPDARAVGLSSYHCWVVTSVARVRKKTRADYVQTKVSISLLNFIVELALQLRINTDYFL